MKINVKNMPKINLNDLLRRRKMTLIQFLNEFGITTYEALLSRCERIGVNPPDLEEFTTIFQSTNVTNNPQDGVVVIEFNSDAPETEELNSSEPELSGSVDTSKKNRKRKQLLLE